MHIHEPLLPLATCFTALCPLPSLSNSNGGKHPTNTRWVCHLKIKTCKIHPPGKSKFPACISCNNYNLETFALHCFDPTNHACMHAPVSLAVCVCYFRYGARYRWTPLLLLNSDSSLCFGQDSDTCIQRTGEGTLSFKAKNLIMEDNVDVRGMWSNKQFQTRMETLEKYCL